MFVEQLQQKKAQNPKFSFQILLFVFLLETQNSKLCPDGHTLLCKFCISVKITLINTKLGDFVNLGALSVDQ